MLGKETGKNEVSTKVSAEAYGGAIQNIAHKILTTRFKPNEGQKALDVGGFDLASLDEDVRRSQKFIGDFTHFTLNNFREYIHICEATIAGNKQPEDYSKELWTAIRLFGIQYGDPTAYGIGYYLEYYDMFQELLRTSLLTENFKCNTNLMAIRQSSSLSVSNGCIQGEVKEGYIVFSIDLSKDVDTILDYMINKPFEGNPFKVHVTEIDYYRDLGDNFFAFNNFYEQIRTQFIENILNQTNAVLVENIHDKVYFVAKTDAIPVLDFKIYGIPFEQSFKIELVGE
ncbi:hypothetical protein P9X10_02920 [Bacillus cereus]|nr:hypothetical protein [Bacillus cereus]